MKKYFLLLLIMFVVVFSIKAQNDTIYIMKSGVIIAQYNINTEVDSIIFYKPTILDTISGTFTDSRDGNIYNWVKIGNQVWMAENLAYLPSVVPHGTGSQTSPCFYVYQYNGTIVSDAKATANYSTYGVLYNWVAAMDSSASSTTNPSGVQGVCPANWHLPSDAEWTELANFLGGAMVAGGKLKETGILHWSSPNSGATNETGFTALPGGGRGSSGGWSNITSTGWWWSSTEESSSDAWYRYIYYNYNALSIYDTYKSSGFSVRCVRD